MSSVIEYAAEQEKVVLLDDTFERIGEIGKKDAHTEHTPLHLAFSLFLFDSKGRMLVQRRALDKQTWAGVWSNACCGHPMPGESIEAAVYRRSKYELGVELGGLECILPDFRYRARWNGLWENEFCPVWVGFLEETPSAFAREEVESLDWVCWDAFVSASRERSGGAFAHFSPWSKMEACLLDKSERFQGLLTKWSSHFEAELSGTVL